MKCERCWRGDEAKFRVHTDIIDMKVCAACADQARTLGIAVDVLNRREARNDQGKSEFAVCDYKLKFSPLLPEVPPVKLFP
jgi:hypothetical protein